MTGYDQCSDTSGVSVAQVKEVLAGGCHSAVMMAYGISGAGKTHTIEGSRADPGVLPKALAALFQVQAQSPWTNPWP